MSTLDGVLSGASPIPDLVVDGGTRLSSAEVEERVARLAGGLRELGVGRGDFVAWQSPNRHEGVLLYRACWRLGAVAAPVHHLAGPADAEAMLAQVSPQVVLDVDDLPEGPPVPPGVAAPSDLAAVLFTSGSTGGPKGVLHTQGGLAYKALLMKEVHGLTPDDAILMPAPLAHISGLLNAVVNPGAVPMKTVLMAKWTPEEALELVEAERVTFMIGPPTFFVSMMQSDAFSAERVASLRLLSCGGAGVTPAFVEASSEAFGALVKRTYGSTEAPTVTTSHSGDDPVRARETDGRATGAVELRVVDPGSGSEVPPGEPGELWVRGPELFVGYVDAEATAAAVTSDGWFRTGDLATVAADGWLTIVGRLKDVIIRGGENISASEVESILESHPAVSQAVAVGYPDDRLGERVAAFVVASEPFGLDECRSWFEGRGVAKFKTPEQVIQVDELPLLAAGKPDRAALKARLV